MHKCVGFFFLLPTTTTTMARFLQIWSTSMFFLVLMNLPTVQGIHETGFQLLQDLFSSPFLVKVRGGSKAVICFGKIFFFFFFLGWIFPSSCILLIIISSRSKVVVIYISLCVSVSVSSVGYKLLDWRFSREGFWPVLFSIVSSSRLVWTLDHSWFVYITRFQRNLVNLNVFRVLFLLWITGFQLLDICWNELDFWNFFFAIYTFGCFFGGVKCCWYADRSLQCLEKTKTWF